MGTNRRLAAIYLLAVLIGSTSWPAALRGQELKTVEETYRSIFVKIKDVGGSDFLFSPEVVADKEGSIRLAHSVLLADETGATDYRQSETLRERNRAKKIFQIDDSDLDRAELLFFGTAKEARCNGHRLRCETLPSTGWSRASVSPDFLKNGANEITFARGGSLLIEPGRLGCSYKSRDGGATWTNRELGDKNALQGEYLVRLRLSRYAPHGWAMSPVIDLWCQSDTDAGKPWKIEEFQAMKELNDKQPKGTSLTAWLRTGSTPTPDEKNWTAWRKLDKDIKTDAKTADHRWAQLKYELATTRAQATPRIRSVELVFGGKADEEKIKRGKIRIVPSSTPNRRPVGTLTSVPFVYQPLSPRLKLLREKYQLDKVIAPGKTEMEQLMLLRYWVRNQCHRGWANHPALWIPPWDALLILESRDRPDCLVMCTHFSCIFTQCCLALGWNARHCILDHHCVSEVWVDQHRKWVMMDTGNSAERADVGLHFERGGVPLSARELHLLQRSGKTAGVKVCFTPARLIEKISPLCRPAPTPKKKPLERPDTIPLAELKKYPVCQLDNYRRYAFPPRNNYLDTLYPGELEHGFSHYFYDGYYWVGDSPDDPRLSPEYSRHLPPERAADIDWDLNWVRLHLSETNQAGEVQVDVETGMPNLARLEKITSEGGKEAKSDWQPAAARFTWKLKPGRNVLAVRGVNHWGRAGRSERVELKWTPPH
jgi:hypothetical protein